MCELQMMIVRYCGPTFESTLFILPQRCHYESLSHWGLHVGFWNNLLFITFWSVL